MDFSKKGGKMQKKLFKKLWQFIFLLVVVNIVSGIAVAYMTTETMQWYDNLTHSELNPPRWAFSIIWSILLLLQAIAGTIAWGRAHFRYFIAQLFLNTLWSFCFFYLKSPALALAILILFLLALAANIHDFFKVSKRAGWLLIPTFLWGIFALYLNAILI